MKHGGAVKARSPSRNHRQPATGRGFAGVQTRIDLYTGQLTSAGHLAARENPDTIAAALKWADYWWRHDRYVRAIVDLKVRFALYGLKITGNKQADDPAEVLRRNQFVRSIWRDRWVFDNCIAFWLDDGEGALTLDPLLCA